MADANRGKRPLSIRVGAVLAACMAVSGCAEETSRAITTQQTRISATAPVTEAVKVSVGRFENKSTYRRGIFSDGKDRLGNQAQTVLAAHLNQSNRFTVLDRANLEAAEQEANFSGDRQTISGAQFLITGDVTEFGRKVVGDHQLFGILGRGKTQIAYSKVVLNVVRVKTSEVVFSAQGAGEYALSNREIIGFGGTASYDATLNGKVLDLAIREVVEKLAGAVDQGLVE